MLLWREWVIRVFRPRHQPMTTLLRGQSRAAELMSPVDLVQDSAEKTIKKGLHFCKPLISLVPGARLELARGCPRRILSPLRLPIPPSRQDVGLVLSLPVRAKSITSAMGGGKSRTRVKLIVPDVRNPAMPHRYAQQKCVVLAPGPVPAMRCYGAWSGICSSIQ